MDLGTIYKFFYLMSLWDVDVYGWGSHAQTNSSQNGMRCRANLFWGPLDCCSVFLFPFSLHLSCMLNWMFSKRFRKTNFHCDGPVVGKRSIQILLEKCFCLRWFGCAGFFGCCRHFCWSFYSSFAVSCILQWFRVLISNGFFCVVSWKQCLMNLFAWL